MTTDRLRHSTSKPGTPPRTSAARGFSLAAALDGAQHTVANPAGASAQDILQLQRTAGNQAVAQLLQRSAAAGAAGGDLDGATAQAIAQARGGGQALDPGTQSQMSSAFGADFSAVKVHRDARSDTLNRSLNARAFTLGSDIYFSRGAYEPGSASGKQLLAHELTHVVQQGAGGGGVQAKLRVGAASDPYEREADQTARQVMGHLRSNKADSATKPGAGLHGVQRKRARPGAALRVQRASGRAAGVIRRDFQTRAEEFETSLGLYAFQHPKSNAAAVAMSDKVRQYIERKGQEDGTTEKQVDSLWQKAGTSNKGIAGAVGERVEDIKQVFAKGNLRERMTHVYNFMAHHFGGVARSGNKDELTKLVTNQKALGKAFDKQGENQAQSGDPDSDVYFEDVLHRAAPKQTALAQQKQMRINSGQDSTSERTVGDVGFRKEGGLLSKREARHMYGKLDDPESIKGKQLTWSEGARAWKLDKTNEWVRMMSDMSLPLMAGPSAHTNAFMNIATLLGIKDLASVRLAAIGQLVPIRAHSLVEIMTAAAGHGLGFTEGPEMYRSLAPLSQKELREQVGNGAFPDEFGSAATGAGGDYQKLVNKYRVATKLVASGLIDEDPARAYKTLSAVDAAAESHIAKKQKEKAKLKNNPSEAERLDQRIKAVEELRGQLKQPLGKAKAGTKLNESRKRIEELQGKGEFKNKLFHGTHTGLLAGLEKSEGTLISAEELEKRGIVRSSGEGDFFSSGEEKGPKKFISVGVGEFGLGTAGAYALATAKLRNYNVELYSDAELEDELHILQDAIDHFDPGLVAMKEGEREFKSKGQLQSLYDRLEKEQQTRAKLPLDHPRHKGELTDTSSYPLLFEFEGVELDVRDEGNRESTEKFVETERVFRDLLGERMVYGGTIDLKPRIHRAYCPAARIDEVTAKLTRIMGHSNFEVLAIEALEGLPKTGFVGGALYETFATLDDFEDVRKRVIRAYAQGMTSKTQVDNVFQLSKEYDKAPRKARAPKSGQDPESTESKPPSQDQPPKKEPDPNSLQTLLQQDNLRVQRVAGNGNCLFASVLLQLQRQGTEYTTPQELRQALANNIRRAPKEYKREVLAPIFSVEGLSVDEAARRIQKPGYWNGLVGDTAPQLLANLLERSIVIYRSGGKQTLAPRGPSRFAELKIVYNGSNHYDSTLPSGVNVPQGELVKKIEDTGSSVDSTVLESPKENETGPKLNEKEPKQVSSEVNLPEKQTGAKKSKGKANIVLSGHGLLKETTQPTKLKVPSRLSISYVGPMGSILDNPLANAVEEGRFKPEDMLVEAISMESGFVTELEPAEIIKLYKIFGPRTVKGGDVTPNYTLTPPQKLEVAVNEQVVTVDKHTTLEELLPRFQKEYPQGAAIHWAACQDLPGVDRAFQIKVMHIKDRYKVPTGMKPRDTTGGKARKDEIKKITNMIKDFKEL